MTTFVRHDPLPKALDSMGEIEWLYRNGIYVSSAYRIAVIKDKYYCRLKDSDTYMEFSDPKNLIDYIRKNIAVDQIKLELFNQ